MITEDYVSFETAKLLKEKGFDSDAVCRQSYDVYTMEILPHCSKHGGQINAPTLQMAMKWLREEHKICIQLTFHPNIKDWGWYFMFLVTGIDGIKTRFRSYGPFKTYSSYEQACEAAIKYCLENLI